MLVATIVVNKESEFSKVRQCAERFFLGALVKLRFKMRSKHASILGVLQEAQTLSWGLV